MADDPEYDVTIIGGGPGGSTTGALLRKYSDFKVLILEREQFPREHVGESQLPPIGRILEEMGCWDEVEKANFPIKIGATLRWGQSDELWDLNFLPNAEFKGTQRPAPYAGQRLKTALQVDRAIYDDILLRHAQSLGCEVRQGTKVTGIQKDGDRVTGLELADGTRVRSRWYVDASGHGAVLRRGMGIGIECPAKLKNVAAWDYWDNVSWADTIGRGGTRVQVLSVGYGWLWFIPVTATRASVGLVVSADYYKKSGRSLPELYFDAIEQDPRVRELTADAKPRGDVHTTKDWSFLADRACGDNWFLVGEAVGFADPILAAGMTLTHTGGRELAYTLLALLRGEHKEDWLKRHYERNQRTRIWQHIRFADFWYATNGQFTDLKDQCQRIARDAGLSLSSEEAWQWLSQGGFTNDVMGQPIVGSFDLASSKQLTQRFLGQDADWQASKVNMVRLSLKGATKTTVPYYREGKVVPIQAFERGNDRLLMVGVVGMVAKLMPRFPNTVALMKAVEQQLTKQLGTERKKMAMHNLPQALEMLLSEGWASGIAQDGYPFMKVSTPDEGAVIRSHRPILSGTQQG